MDNERAPQDWTPAEWEQYASNLEDMLNANRKKVRSLSAEVKTKSDLIDEQDKHIFQLGAENSQVRKDLMEAIDESVSLTHENAVMKQALKKLAKLPASEYDTLPGTLAAVHIIAGSVIPASTQHEESDTCPECHGTGRTVISGDFGVEDCPACWTKEGSDHD